MIKAFAAHKPDAIGLSGLLVKSAQQMVITANDLKDAGIDVPLLVGGAALSAKFTLQKIAPSYGGTVCYAKDAMTGLRLMNELMDPATRARVLSEHAISGNGVSVTTTVKIVEKPEVARSPKVGVDLLIPDVGYLDRKVRLVPDLRELWSYLNPFMLYGRHMGYRGDFEKHLAAREPKAVELFAEMEEVKNEAAAFMKVRAVWQFFEAEAEGKALHLYAPGAKEPLLTWNFKRQKTGDQLCLSDYVFPQKMGSATIWRSLWFPLGKASGNAQKRPSTKVIISNHTVCKRWRLRPQKRAQSGYIGEYVRTGDSLIHLR